jgi:hypothetical protein
VALLAQISWSLRQFAAATRVFQRSERAGKSVSVRDALVAAGVRTWPDALQKAERHLRQVGRARGSRLYQWLLEADLAIKGTHASPDRARWVLERLILRLARPLATA